MKKIIIILFSLLLVPLFLSSQRQWEPKYYFLKGRMFGIDNVPLANDTFLFYNDGINIITNDSGEFTIKVYINPSNDFCYKNWKYLNLVNPKFLVFEYSPHNLAFVKNKWRKFKDKERTYRVNIYWPVFNYKSL